MDKGPAATRLPLSASGDGGGSWSGSPMTQWDFRWGRYKKTPDKKTSWRYQDRGHMLAQLVYVHDQVPG